MTNPANPATANTAPSRDDDIRDFVANSDWHAAFIAPLRIDASIRRFFRLTKGGETAVLMDARPPLEDTTVFEFMAAKFRKLGFSVPEIYTTDHARGLVIMEDFGDDTMFFLLEKGADAGQFLRLAMDAQVHKYHADPAIALEGCAPLADAYWMHRVEQLLLHYMPMVEKTTPSPDSCQDYMGLFKEALAAAQGLPKVLLHGDFGVNNLFYLPGRPGIRALGLVDFQDLTDARGNMCGSPAFDPMFLLQDVRMDFPGSLEDELKTRFLAETGIKDIEQFELEYATISAMQSAKCLGLFARLGYREKREFYLPFIPNCWRNLRRSLKVPAMAKIKRWFDTTIPNWDQV